MEKFDVSDDMFTFLTENKTKCIHCGRSQMLGTKDRCICKYCGNYIYKDEKTMFKYKMKELRLEKNNRISK